MSYSASGWQQNPRVHSKCDTTTTDKYFINFVTELDGSKEKQWACDDVVVMYKDRVIRFPIYDWIETEITVASGKAFSYTKASPELKKVREEEVEYTKGKFPWIPIPTKADVGWGIPRYVDSTTYSGLPKILKRTEERTYGFYWDAIIGILIALLGSVTAIMTVPFHFVLEDFRKLYKYVKTVGRHIKVDDPPFFDRWSSDEEFGRQQIMGVTPLALKRCTSLPDGCNITDENLDLKGKTLKEEMSEGRIFIGDFSTVFDGVERNVNEAGELLYCPHAIGLFRASECDNLLPIAIQLIPGESDSIFTPNDDKNDWLLAKMYYRVATSNMHEWHYHFLLTHNVMEPFAVALFRNIPRSHPLYKLLRPHLQTVSAINTAARQSLIGKGSEANKALAILGIALSRSTYKDFNMKDLNLPSVIKERGLDDRSILPGNYFRDDALKLWPIIEDFVKSMLRLYYNFDKDVADDKDIQAFAEDVATNGLGWQDGNTKGMQKEITSLDQLIELCTILIYTSSAGHAAVNFPQFQNYQFIPNSPLGMRMPPHKTGDKVNSKRILDSLPDLVMSDKQIIITYTLSAYSENEIYLGDYPMKLFTEDRAQVVIKKFRDDLREYENAIKNRNERVGREGYKWLLPSHIPNSIAV